MDLKNKLLEIASIDFGGNAEDYDIDGERVFAKSDPAKGLTYGEAAQRAIDIGGKYSGEALPEDIFFLTKASASAIAGTGLVGVAKDNYEKDGVVPALAVAYIMIELDLETGLFEILEYHATADCGTVIHPKGLASQIRGGAVMGIGRTPAYTRPSRRRTWMCRRIYRSLLSTSRTRRIRLAPKVLVSH